MKRIRCLMLLTLFALLLAPALLRAEPGFPAKSEESPAQPEPFPTAPGQDIAWLPLEDGLDMALLSFTEKGGGEFSRRITIRALRFDTSRYDICLCSSRWEKAGVPTLREWAEKKDLTAAINACMYLKDGQTSTGYMRGGDKINNGRIVSRYGSFFVASPRVPGLPRAAVLDRNVDDWRSLLPQYDIVVQNFRLMGPGGEQVWPEHGPEHAVAAIAEDMNGRILFLLGADPSSVHDFVKALNAHKGLNLNSAMYVEGGSEASLLLRLSGRTHLWSGMSPASYLLSSRGDDFPLPNILGIRRR
ncbi:hypothetical protein [Mailhella massiliensis]|uniref:Phosphodiester glycosidase family protein n=1 Tax=Mailhella massiliensis TaxID=1903261 RepID=A0A921AXS2_9BACT|nr:hypothetical protein [Mailhella massiliensis]HJD97723.1 phosphodiester glycosidase family protein [Mailhella massiliensis]